MSYVYLTAIVPHLKVFHAGAFTSQRKAEEYIMTRRRLTSAGNIVSEWLANTCKVTLLGHVDAVAWIHKTQLR